MSYPRRPSATRFAVATLCIAVLLPLAQSRIAHAQAIAGGNKMPSGAYYSYIAAMHAGDYKTALKGFEDEISGAMKTVDSRWVDSICGFTMAGEVYYKMGNLSAALDHYNAAMTVFVAYPDWMLRVQFPDSIAPLRGAGATPWGGSQRATRVGEFPETMLVLFSGSRVTARTEGRQATLIPNNKLLSLNVVEVVRCTALAIRRRSEILGPAYQFDQLSRQIAGALGRRNSLVPPNHWSLGWVELQLGMVMAAEGKTAQALGHLQRSLQIAGEFDHPVTALALLELGRLAMEAGDFATASTFFAEATYSGAQYGDYTTLEEAFRYGQTIHLMTNAEGYFPPLDAAMAWSRNRAPELNTSLTTLAAENFAVRGEFGRAASLVGEIRSRLARSPMGQGEIGSRANYVAALIDYGRGNSVAGDKAIGAAMQYYRKSSKWLSHLATIDAMVVSRRTDISPRKASQLYEFLLREPTAFDWGIRPLECLAVLFTPHHGSYERWFEAAINNTGDADSVLEIADRARRHRFQSSQPLGGRLLALRWLLEAPPEQLDADANLRREDLLTRYPDYRALSDESRQIRQALRLEPLVAADQDALRAQSGALERLAKISQSQEAILRAIAIRREPASMSFPPIRRMKDIQKTLPQRHLLLTFFSTSRATYGFLYSRDQSARWKIASPAELDRRMMALLKSIGQMDANRELTDAQLSDDSWRAAAADVTKQLFEGSKINLAEGCDELIVVPDGLLWYLPFELLQVTKDNQTHSLIDVSRVRYAPTAGLAVSFRHGRKVTGNTAVAVGKLYPRDDASTAMTAFERMQQTNDSLIALATPLPAASSLYKTLFDGLIVLDDLAGTDSPYGWSPVQMDRVKSSGQLANWLSLPLGGPDYVVLPGYHTAAENGLRRRGNGQEIFLSLCGMMSTGTRTVLMSRWRTGGQTSYDLVREFVQELPRLTAADAWQRSVQLIAETTVNPAAEPRVKVAASGTPPKASHPFFWAGYMLVDSGSRPGAEELIAEPEKPKLDFEKQSMGAEALLRADNDGDGDDSNDKDLPAVETPDGSLPALDDPTGNALPEMTTDETTPSVLEDDVVGDLSAPQDDQDNTKTKKRGKSKRTVVDLKSKNKNKNKNKAD